MRLEAGTARGGALRRRHRLEAAVVEDRVARAIAVGRNRLVRCRAGHRPRRVGVVVLGEVVEELVARTLAEACGEPAEQLRAPRLVASAAPEQLPRYRVGRVDVHARERRRRRLLERRAGVDALDVGVDVVQQRTPALALLLEQPGLLGLDHLIDLWRGLDLLEPDDEVDR